MSWSIVLTIIFAVVFLIIIIQFTTQQPAIQEPMKKFLNKAKAAFEDASQPAQLPAQHDGTSEGTSTISQPTAADVTRYRYHHGTNLGSVFVLERWLTGYMFSEGTEGSSELASVESWVKREGIDKTRERFEKHWREYISDADLDWLKDTAKCTTVRLPIGYFTLGPAHCQKTPFEAIASVYQNAWQAVKDLIGRCQQRGIGVLVDLHGLPRGANGGDHSGTNSGKAGFWDHRKHRDLGTRCLCFIAQQVKSIEGIAGLQIVNESEFNAAHMYEWYDEALKEVAKIDSTMPVYVSDGWDLTRCAEWSRKKNAVRIHNESPVVIDTHLYWTFTEDDQKKSPQQITGEVWTKLHENELNDGSVTDRGAAQAIVGEYSCVLSDPTWSKSAGESKDKLVRDFGSAESQRYQQRAGGSFFWTYRMDWMPGGEWGFRQMTESHAITPPASLTLPASDVHHRIANAQPQRDGRRGNTWGAHCQFWDTNHPGHYEHWRFEKGWNLGWDDAMAFFGMRSQQGQQGADKIGMLELWVLKRLRESDQDGSFMWEFEQGLRQGIRDFYEAAGV